MAVLKPEEAAAKLEDLCVSALYSLKQSTTPLDKMSAGTAFFLNEDFGLSVTLCCQVRAACTVAMIHGTKCWGQEPGRLIMLQVLHMAPLSGSIASQQCSVASQQHSKSL